MDTTTPQTPIIRGLSEVDQSFVRTQRAQNIPTVASGSVSPVTLNDIDFTPAQGITGVGTQHMRPYVTSVDDDDMVTECGDLDSGNDLNMSDDGMDGIELDKMRKQREQHFSHPRSTIEDFAPAAMQQKVFYVRDAEADAPVSYEIALCKDPEFGMIIDMGDQWTLTAAFQRVLMYCSELHKEFNVSFNVQKRSDMSSSQQHRLMEQCQASEYVLMGFKSEKDLQIALSKRMLIQGMEMSTKRYIYAREPLSRTLADYESTRSTGHEIEKDQPMEDMLSGLSAIGVSSHRADEDVEMG